MRGQVPADYVWRSASLGWEAFDFPAVPYRDCRMLAEMLVGYHRNVSAASPAGPPGAHWTRGPLGVQAARALIGTSLFRLQSAAPCLGSPRRIISAHAAASNRVLPRAVSGLDRTTMIASRPRLRPKRCKAALRFRLDQSTKREARRIKRRDGLETASAALVSAVQISVLCRGENVARGPLPMKAVFAESLGRVG